MAKRNTYRKYNKEKMEKYNKYHIIRAVNYCDMKREELLKEAIEKRVTIGEIYYEKMFYMQEKLPSDNVPHK